MDLLYNGWGSLEDELRNYINNVFEPNQPDTYIKCAYCGKKFHYQRDCHPYSKKIPEGRMGYCFSCARNEMHRLPIYMWDEGVIAMIDEYSQIEWEIYSEIADEDFE